MTGSDGDEGSESGSDGADDAGRGSDGAREVACAHCGSTDTEPISLFGTGEMTMQYECHECHSVFERVKW
ncbi:MAG: hypothetical protein ABEJ28_05075 [Salinigranum sp.]